MRRSLKRYQLWIFYAAFLMVAITTNREGFLSIPEEYAFGKIALLFVYLVFLAYSLYATSKENFFKTLNNMFHSWWGRQVGVDLYISVFLSLALIYIIEGSLLVTLLWFIPVFVFANLAILPYLLLNYSAVVAVLVN